MSVGQILTIVVLLAVVAVLLSERVSADVVALLGAAALGLAGVVTVKDLQQSFANPAILTLASLFIIVQGLERAGVIQLLFRGVAGLVRRFGRSGALVVIALCGALSAFISNTPLVLIAAPLLRDIAHQYGLAPRRLLIPLSYATILGGACTLIGTSSNLIVNEGVRRAGIVPFGLFDITAPGLCVASVGALYLAFVAPRLLPKGTGADEPSPGETTERELRPRGAVTSVLIFALVIGGAVGGVPIAMSAFVGAMLLLGARVLTADDLYGALNPQLLAMIGGMLVIGAAVDRTGLAVAATEALGGLSQSLGPRWALAGIYVLSAVMTELMSHAAVAVLITPVAIALAETLGVDSHPFAVAVMFASGVSFATPFGYQTNTIVYAIGGYRYADFLRVGLPLSVLTGATALAVIPHFFPF